MRTAVLLLMVAAMVGPAMGMDRTDLLCGCADGFRNIGDYVSCVAMLSPRLVASGELTRGERAALVRDAHGGPPAGLDCGSLDQLRPLVYGLGANADRVFYGVGETVHAELILWNQTTEEVSLGTCLGERGAGWDLRILEASGLVVHGAPACCPFIPHLLELAPGEEYRRAVGLRLVTWNAETGEPDGVPLDPGVYWLEAVLKLWTQEANPVVRVPIRIEE